VIRPGGRLDFQRRESRDLDRLLRDRRVASEGRRQPESPAAPESAPAIAADGLIGRIEIPRLLVSAVVVEGSTKPLCGARWDIFPARRCGRAGNVGLAGHRDTFFRPLQEVRVKDQIQLATLRGNFRL